MNILTQKQVVKEYVDNLTWEQFKAHPDVAVAGLAALLNGPGEVDVALQSLGFRWMRLSEMYYHEQLHITVLPEWFEKP